MIGTRSSLPCPTGVKLGAFFIICLTIIGAFLNVGCSDKEQSKVVDFSNTIIMERPDTRDGGTIS